MVVGIHNLSSGAVSTQYPPWCIKNHVVRQWEALGGVGWGRTWKGVAGWGVGLCGFFFPPSFLFFLSAHLGSSSSSSSSSLAWLGWVWSPPPPPPPSRTFSSSTHRPCLASRVGVKLTHRTQYYVPLLSVSPMRGLLLMKGRENCSCALFLLLGT